ncbi:MAG: hypothetical protein VX784_05905 [Pseudomonadota bacterium]|nr:hypothetical protein [Pseudomonadota bacterium]
MTRATGHPEAGGWLSDPIRRILHFCSRVTWRMKMDKVARIVSQDFHSPDGKIEFRKRQLEFQRNMDEVELIISVDTADDAMMTIFVFPDESARLRTENKRLELKYDEVFGDLVKERTVFDGDVNYWFQQIKYLGAAVRSTA